MRVLLATSSGDDYLSACLFDGFQTLFGWENVSDAGFSPCLHNYTSAALGPCGRVGGFHVGQCAVLEDGNSYDLLVLTAAMLRDHDWAWAARQRDQHLKEGGKVAFVEGGDHWLEVNPPPFPVDGVFRREMLRGHDYGAPYGRAPRHVAFSAPERWLDGADNPSRGHDLLVCGSHQSNPLRWEALPWCYMTARRHNSIVASCGISYDRYFDYLRNSKLALCCPGGGSDCMKFAEAVACGAIPLFLGPPTMVREDWYGEDCSFACHTVEGIPGVIEQALSSDLDGMRGRLLDHVRKYFTTRALARKIMKEVGLT